MAEVSIDLQSPEDKIAETLRTAKFEAERCLREMALDTSDERESYVYALFRPDGSIRYVGKGTGNRIYKHQFHGDRHRNWRLAADYKIYGRLISKKIVSGLTHDEAYAVEETLIHYFGIEADGCGPLANLDYGGRGSADVSEETRAKMSASSKRVNALPEIRARKSASVKQTNKDPDVQARRRAAMKLTCNSQEWKAARKEGMSAAWKRDDVREKYCEIARRTNADPKKKKQQSDMMLAYWEQNSEKFEVRGEYLTISQIADRYGLSYRAVHKRAKKGWRGEQLIQPSLRRV